ncbi:MAG: OsmC family protein [Pseudomonadota bacterium]
MKARIKWNEGVSFVAESGSGHAIVLDGAPEYGGRNLGPRPMELLLMGAGACSAFDVLLILKKARQAVNDCYVELDAERAETDPKIFTKIHFHFVITGENISTNQVERAIKLSKDKYCSASVMLAKSAELTADFEILNSTNSTFSPTSSDSQPSISS